MTTVFKQLLRGFFHRELLHNACTGAFFAGLLLLCAIPLRARQEDEWTKNLRKEVDSHHLTLALAIADQRLAAEPGDTDAMD